MDSSARLIGPIYPFNIEFAVRDFRATRCCFVVLGGANCNGRHAVSR